MEVFALLPQFILRCIVRAGLDGSDGMNAHTRRSRRDGLERERVGRATGEREVRGARAGDRGGAALAGRRRGEQGELGAILRATGVPGIAAGAGVGGAWAGLKGRSASSALWRALANARVFLERSNPSQRRSQTMTTLWTDAGKPIDALANGTTVEMVLSASGLAWEVEKRQAMYRGNAGEMKAARGQDAPVRTDNGRAFPATVGPVWEPFQNADLVRFARSLGAQGEVVPVKAGPFGTEGERTMIELRIGRELVVRRGE